MDTENYYSHGDGDVFIKCVYCGCPCTNEYKNSEGEPCHEDCLSDYEKEEQSMYENYPLDEERAAKQ